MKEIKTPNLEPEYQRDDYISPKLETFGKYAVDASDIDNSNTLSRLNRQISFLQQMRDTMVRTGDNESYKESSDGINRLLSRLETKYQEQKDGMIQPESYRERLENLSDKEKQRVNRVLNDNPYSPYIENILGYGEDVIKYNTGHGDKVSEPIDFVGALIKKDNTGEYLVTTDQFLNFLQWHNYNIAQKQKKIDHEVALDKGRFKRGVLGLIKNGALPESVADNIKRIKNVSVVIDDGFTLESNIAGKVTAGDQIIVGSELDKKTLYHEFVHIIAGGHTEFENVHQEVNESSGEVDNLSSQGGLRRITDEEIHNMVINESDDIDDYDVYITTGWILNEAVTEKIARKIGPPRFDSLAYSKFIILLDGLTELGREKIDIKDFYTAYFDETDNIEAIGLLKEKLKTAFPGVDLLKEIGQINTKGHYNKRVASSIVRYKDRFNSIQNYLDYLEGVGNPEYGDAKDKLLAAIFGQTV